MGFLCLCLMDPDTWEQAKLMGWGRNSGGAFPWTVPISTSTHLLGLPFLADSPPQPGLRVGDWWLLELF